MYCLHDLSLVPDFGNELIHSKLSEMVTSNQEMEAMGRLEHILLSYRFCGGLPKGGRGQNTHPGSLLGSMFWYLRISGVGATC